MEVRKMLANKNNHGGYRNKAPQWIVIHYTGNDGDTAQANCNYFKSGIRNASAHRFADDHGVIISVPDDYVAWSVGGKKYTDCDKTGGGRYYGICTNNNSLSLELCDCVRNGKYDFTEETLQNAAEQVVAWMTQYGIPISHVIRHFDVTGKICPAPMVSQNGLWEAFISRVDNLYHGKDEALTEAISALNKSVGLDTKIWGSTTTMKMNLVPALLHKLGGIPYLVNEGVIHDRELWDSGKYQAKHVRSLIIQYYQKFLQ